MKYFIYILGLCICLTSFSYMRHDYELIQQDNCFYAFDKRTGKIWIWSTRNYKEGKWVQKSI
jgi:hypothetical protein